MITAMAEDDQTPLLDDPFAEFEEWKSEATPRHMLFGRTRFSSKPVSSLISDD